MEMIHTGAVWFLQGVPPRALVMAMTLAYALCFAGMIFAYITYRRRQKTQKKDEERKP
jgi:hypothetical protein